ncbi:MAG: hypothetical protein ACLR2O_09935 [Coprococcus sp.]
MVTYEFIMKGELDERNYKRIEWHPAFQASIQIEFEEECDKLTFEAEHLLSKSQCRLMNLL